MSKEDTGVRCQKLEADGSSQRRILAFQGLSDRFGRELRPRPGTQTGPNAFIRYRKEWYEEGRISYIESRKGKITESQTNP